MFVNLAKYDCIVAFEVTKRLEAMGDEVDFINISPGIAPCMKKIDWTSRMLDLMCLFGLMSKHDTIGLAPLRLLTEQEQLELVGRKSLPDRIVKLQLTLEKLGRWVDLSMSLFRCGRGYNPSGSIYLLTLEPLARIPTPQPLSVFYMTCSLLEPRSTGLTASSSHCITSAAARHHSTLACLENTTRSWTLSTSCCSRGSPAVIFKL